jgi:transcription termination factor NusB
MLTFSQKARLLKLRMIFAWDMAQAKQEGQTFVDEKEELDTLSMMQISTHVANALNEDLEYRDAPLEKLEALMCAISTALKGVKMLRKEDPELAYALGVQLQAELEQTLRGKLDDGQEDRPGGRRPPSGN